ncbi:hypothetical protein GGQ61_002269 [Phenylobacterium haematophilum]|uniref:Sialate O-acetylesterase domain-containing protein n=1 Tax=Phenylobacterium haematophilum TaxID=98513 RepID=A0A840A200_9CAUL|nr:sialate O-acetylesterase [Phenylobacterium haematophilum]MBB3891541.1 hypothetical protein [Phenylobacterium haematophilum]
MDIPFNAPDCLPAMIIVAGQSNALGYTLGAADLPSHLIAPGSAQIWSPQARAFVPLQPAANTGAPNNPQTWGPESQFAYRWRQDHACAPLYVVKYARGETGLAPDPAARDWSPSSHGDLWDAATAEIDAAKAALAAQGLAPRVRAVLWMQGETDAQSPAKSRAYAANLAAFVAQVRARWGDADTIVQIGQIDRPGPAGWETVRQAQARVAGRDAKTTLTDTDPFERQPADGVHLTASGQVRLGDEFYERLAAVRP